jgi:hypothetical protein
LTKTGFSSQTFLTEWTEKTINQRREPAKVLPIYCASFLGQATSQVYNQ